MDTAGNGEINMEFSLRKALVLVWTVNPYVVIYTSKRKAKQVVHSLLYEVRLEGQELALSSMDSRFR